MYKVYMDHIFMGVAFQVLFMDSLLVKQVFYQLDALLLAAIVIRI